MRLRLFVLLATSTADHAHTPQMCHDMKYGYNSRQQLAMAIWLSVPSSFEYNEVAVLLEDE